MIMSNGHLRSALACAFVGLIFSCTPGFAQRSPVRKASAQRRPQYAANRYIIFLQDPPVSSRFNAREQVTAAAPVSYRAQIETKQRAMKTDLASRRIQVAGSVSSVLNAIFVVATPDRLPELRSMSGVIGVMPERLAKRSLNKATGLANAPAAWAQAAIGGQANAGKNIKIGILDTGIDQTHPAFNDAGFTAPSGFPKCNVQSDCTKYTNNKVIVARSYVPMISAGTNPSNPAANSLPDDFSARDRDGHGTGVAAAAAAVQNSAGTEAFSGMAPGAYLGSYKIFGSDGVAGNPSESVIIKALEDAIADGMDVVSISSGFPSLSGALDDVQCGNTAGVPCDPLAQAFETAAKGGLIVTVSAGNGGSDDLISLGENYPGYNTITSPATAPSVISVGATLNSHVFNPAVSVNGSGAPSNLKGIAAAQSDYFPYGFFGFNFTGGLSATLIDVTKLGDDGHACSALPAGSLNNSFALIQRGPTSCSFDTKITNATNAGAIGVVLYMADSSPLVTPEGTIYGPGPVVMISLSAGQALKSYVDANPGTSVTIDSSGSEQLLTSLVNTLASYSSFGPTTDGRIKPDIVATGGFDVFQYPDPNDSYLPAPSGIFTAAQNYDPNGEMFSTTRYAAVDGTSFAAPLVAGAAAMIKQAHPGWSAAEIKSALLNNSAQDVTQDDFGDPVDVEWMGAGRLDANAAITTSVTAVPSTLSFGYLKSGSPFPSPIAVTVSNKGASSVTLAVAVVTGVPATGATVTADQKSLTIAAGQSATLNVTLAGTVPLGGEYNGTVTLTSASPAVSLHIPYMFLVGDGSFPNVTPLYGPFYGAVNQDLGPIAIQVVDSWGVPVSNSTVTFTVTPRGGVSLRPVPGVPGGTTGLTIPFQPSNCSPSTSASSVTCTTNNYGIAWIEVVGGPNTFDAVANPVTIDATSQGQDITFSVGLVTPPNLTQVVDAGAFGPTISPGSYVTLFGSNLVDPDSLINASGDSANTVPSGGRLPLTWDGVTVSFDAPASGSLPAASAPGYVYYVSPGQVNIWAPYELENYPSAQMKVSLSGIVLGNVLTVPMKNYSPAFLMYNSGSVFIADAIDPTCPPPYIVGTACPAARGNLIELYVNGLGPVTNQPASGEVALSSPLSQTPTNPVVMIGGQQAQVQFSGLAPGFVGLYQVNVFVPSGISTGNQPITIAMGGVTSPSSISASGTTYNIVVPVK